MQSVTNMLQTHTYIYIHTVFFFCIIYSSYNSNKIMTRLPLINKQKPSALKCRLIAEKHAINKLLHPQTYEHMHSYAITMQCVSMCAFERANNELYCGHTFNTKDSSNELLSTNCSLPPTNTYKQIIVFQK